MSTAYSVYTSFLERLRSCAPRRLRAWRRQYGQHRTEPYSRTEVARYRPINQRDLRFDQEDPDAQVGPHGGPTATAARDAEMTDPLAACNTDSSSPFLSLVVQADRDFAPGLRGRAIHAASMKRPGACAPAAASKHRAEQTTHRAGQAPPRTGPSLMPRTRPGPTRRSTSDPAPSALEAGATTR